MPTRDISAVIGAPQHRTCKLDLADATRAIDEEARTVELAFSSEAPVERFFGIEILDHGKRSVRMDRLADSAALLLQHDSDRQIGVVESASIDADRTGRARVRFGRSALAEEVWRDVLDGIRRHVSVGYVIHDLQPDESDKSGDTYRATDWEPLEISIVSVPADASVGVGRAGDTPPRPRHPKQETATMPDDTRDDVLDDERNDMAREADDVGADDAEADTETRESDAEDREIPIARRAEISRMRAYAAKHRLTERAEELIEADGTLDDLKAAHRRRIANATPEPVPATRDVRITGGGVRYKALRGFKDDVSAYRMGQWARATVFGDQRAQRWCNDHNVRVMTTAAVSKGGAVVPDEMSQAIIDLRETYGAARRLARVVPMTSDTMTVPRRTSGVTAYFVGQETAGTESDKAWDQVQLTARKLMTLTRISSDYAEDAVIDVAGDLASEMAYSFAEKEDDCYFNGDGSSTFGGIVGVRPKLIDGSHTAGAIDAASGIDTYAEVTADELHSIMGALPVYAQSGAQFVCSQPGNALVFDALKAAAGGNSTTTLAGRVVPAYLGYPITVNQKMPTSTGDLSNVVMILFGNFELASTLGDRRGFRLQVLNERYAEYDQIGIKATERFDIVWHDLGDTSTAGPVVGLVGE